MDIGAPITKALYAKRVAGGDSLNTLVIGARCPSTPETSMRMADVQLLLFEKELQEKSLQPGIDIPIDVPQVIADDIVAISANSADSPFRLERRSPFRREA